MKQLITTDFKIDNSEDEDNLQRSVKYYLKDLFEQYLEKDYNPSEITLIMIECASEIFLDYKIKVQLEALKNTPIEDCNKLTEEEQDKEYERRTLETRREHALGEEEQVEEAPSAMGEYLSR